MHAESFIDAMLQFESVDALLVPHIQPVLCPDVWYGDHTIHPEVREALLKIANQFMQGLEIHAIAPEDIIFTGSLANYNYTTESDMDLHILMDFKKMHQHHDLVHEYFHDVVAAWNEHHKITIHKHPVEIYIQDISEPHVSTGVFSLRTQKWIRIPTRHFPHVDVQYVAFKLQELQERIHRLLAMVDQGQYKRALPLIKRMRDRIREMRRVGLLRGGEFSTENLVFKAMRKDGTLDKLLQAERTAFDKSMTVESADQIVELGPIDQYLRQQKFRQTKTLGAGPSVRKEWEREGVIVRTVGDWDWHYQRANNEFLHGPSSKFKNLPTYINHMKQLGYLTNESELDETQVYLGNDTNHQTGDSPNHYATHPIYKKDCPSHCLDGCWSCHVGDLDVSFPDMQGRAGENRGNKISIDYITSKKKCLGCGHEQKYTVSNAGKLAKGEVLPCDRCGQPHTRGTTIGVEGVKGIYRELKARYPEATQIVSDSRMTGVRYQQALKRNPNPETKDIQTNVAVRVR